MKEIKAYIRKTMMDGVIDALEAIPGIPGVAFSEVGGYGHRASDGYFQRISMMKLEIDVPDDMTETVIECILEHARTGAGHLGDGRIYISELTESINVRDGSRGAEVLKSLPGIESDKNET